MSKPYKTRVDVGIARPYRYKVIDGEKQCTICKEFKSVKDNFRVSANGPTIDGNTTYISWCYPCETEYFRAKHLKKKYSMTGVIYAEMVLAQDGCCYICNEATNLVIDHDHDSGKVRKLLCHGCNRGLGFFKENAESLEAAAKYITEMKEQ